MEKRTLQFNNILCIQNQLTKQDPKTFLGELEKELLGNGVYCTGPKMFRRVNKESKTILYLYLPLSDKISVNKEKNKFQFYDQLSYQKCLYKRIIEEDNQIEETKKAMKIYAEQTGLVLDTEGCFYVVINIPNGEVVDLYWPILGGVHDLSK
ncbi:MAG: hypothetical protein PHW34_08390 [Hespellia sp.]|nr:hypothetical protein [Hespellia sp.]